MRKTMKYASMLVAVIGFLAISCKKDKPKTVPSITTSAVTDITPTSAKGGGKITNNGGADITARGLVFSKTVAQPTIADDKTVETTSADEFQSMMNNLSSGAVYHVRAYATNSVGIGYGQVVDFTTGNAPPTATNVMITGTAEVNKTLTVSYTYADAENNAESGTIIQWYVANDGAGTGETAIAGATSLTFIIQAAQQGKYIRAGITPKAATGTTTGAEVKSGFVGAVGEATTVTFTYNGQTVTYGIINSAATGRKWLDRNLGAPNAPSAYNDYANYGDLFQWGRLADGHQLINRTGPADANMSAVNVGTTPYPGPYDLSPTDNPGHSKFILSPEYNSDWREPKNDNLWQGVNGINNPCPAGWRIATATEWAAENLGNLPSAYTKLKITLTGLHAGDDDGIYQSATNGLYWTSTIGTTFDYRAKRTAITTTATTQSETFRSNGHACRCIKD
jgi:hypothetical protein